MNRITSMVATILRKHPGISALALLLISGLGVSASAQTLGIPGITATPGPNGSQTYSLNIQLLLLLTSLSFLPAMVLLMSSFTRIIIVLSLLRMALGTQSTPPNQVLIGLALFLSFFVMGPTLDRVVQDAYIPFSEGKLEAPAALAAAEKPMREFMMAQTRQADLALFTRLSGMESPESPQAVPFRVLVPAFVTSELKTAFQIGFAVFIPFLVIDMVVASVLMAMGMMMVSPAIVALPFKIMLFVLVDGWQLLVGALAQSFNPSMVLP